MGSASSTPSCNCNADTNEGGTTHNCGGYSNENGQCDQGCQGNTCGAIGATLNVDSTLAIFAKNDCSNCNEIKPILPLLYTYFPSIENPLITLVRDSNQYIVYNDNIHYLFDDITPEEILILRHNMKKWNKFNYESRLLQFTVVRTIMNSVNSNIYTKIQEVMKKIDYSTFVTVDNDHSKFMLNRYLTNIITRLLALSIYSDELNYLSFDQLYNVLSQYLFFIFAKFDNVLISRCSFELLRQYGYVKPT